MRDAARSEPAFLRARADSARVSPRRVALTLALFAAIAAGLFVHLDRGEMGRASEQRCFTVVSEMLRSGDWLVPRFEGALRLQKPPLFYWAGASAAALAGEQSLWTLRAVSAVAALALAACVFAVGRSFGDSRAGLLCTAVLGATWFFYDRGRTGDAEMLLALFVFAALAVFERLWRTRDARLLPALALLLGLGFLTKATAALLGVLAPIAVWLVLQRSTRLALRPAVLGWGLVAAAIGLSWYGAILARVPGSGALFSELLLSPFGVQGRAASARALVLLAALPARHGSGGTALAMARLRRLEAALLAQRPAAAVLRGQLRHAPGRVDVHPTEADALSAGARAAAGDRRRARHRAALLRGARLGPEPDDLLAALDAPGVALDHAPRV